MNFLKTNSLQRVLSAVYLLVTCGCAPFFLTRLAIAQESVAQESVSAAATTEAITLERIMSDPEWIGRGPQSAYWADDSVSIYYQRQRAGSKLKDWFQADLQGNLLRVVQDQDLGAMDADGGAYSRDRRWKAYQRAGDLFLKDLKSGKTRQLTRTRQRESAPRFMADGRRLIFRREDTVFARHLKRGLEMQLVDLRTEEDPAESREREREGYLSEQQQRLFETLQKRRAEQDAARQAAEAQQQADPTRVPLPWYLGETHQLESVQVSPSGRWCLVSLAAQQATRGERDKMPEFVDDGGYVDVRNVRSLVGTGKAVSDKLLLLDLAKHQQHELEFSNLPEFDTDPLAEVKAKAVEWRKKQAREDERADTAAESSPDDATSADDKASEGDRDPPKKSGKQSTRAIQVASLEWNDVGDQVAVQLFSADNKDRWIASVDFKSKQLRCLMHRRDPAWINRSVTRIGWLPDQQSLYYVSEESGYAHLYIADVPSRTTRQLTRGKFVVQDVQADLPGKHLYYKANASHPGVYEVYRVEVASGAIEQLTELGGMNDFVVGPDQQHLLVTHSAARSPPELWIQPLKKSAAAWQITQTVTAEFRKLPWVEPAFVTVPSRSGRPIHARLYLPPDNASAGHSPAVIFIHGAGYLQNAHQGWSLYFREFMFHSLLARRGFVVLDMDYRASAGYGRDWRTAIYRHMGGPEVEDLEDGLRWLVSQHGVDEGRVGLYGGSYGGFLTLMALFQKPGKFACGAALRPVTDWAHYNHGYTSNILNTPEIDPEAYQRSSPIEFAQGLADPLLMCHGMVDDNVFFKDTARLAQRLIELKKKDWQVAIYPVEPHGFEQPSSWYDEYRRILELFESVLKP